MEASAGVKVTLMVQELDALSEEPQLLVRAKSAGLVPPSAMLAMLNAAVPVLESVSVCAAEVLPALVLGKVMLVGESVAVGTAAATPVPVRAMDCGEFVALSVAETSAVSVPVVVGVKVMEMLQLAKAASVVPQVVVSLKDEELLPVGCVSAVSVADAFPVLVTVTVCAALVWPTVVLGKVSDAAETVM